MAKSNTLRRKSTKFTFHWWMAVVLVAVVAIIGMAVLYFSHASGAGKIAYSVNISSCKYNGGCTNNTLASQAFTVNSDGSQNTQVTHALAANDQVKWSPDHTKLATRAKPGGVQALFVQNADGSGRKQITSPGVSVNGSGDNYPTWAPNGSKIAFFRQAGSASAIYTVNPDGTGLLKVANVPTSVCSNINCYSEPAVWSPDSTKLLFMALTPTGSVINVINSNGTGLVQLSAETNAQPVNWSPKGSQIIYLIQGSQAQVLKSMASDGTNKRVLAPSVYTIPVGMNSYSADGYSIVFVSSNNKSVQKVNPFNNAITTIYTKPAGDTGLIYYAQFPAGDSSEILVQELTDSLATNYKQLYQLSVYSIFGNKLSTPVSFTAVTQATPTVDGTSESFTGVDW